MKYITASKRLPGSSSSSKAKFDNKKIVSKTAFKRFEDCLIRKTLAPKRGFSPTPGMDGNMYTQINVRNRFEFVNHPSVVVISIVREFYANAIKHQNGRVFAHGKRVSFSPKAINAYYKLPNIEIYEY